MNVVELPNEIAFTKKDNNGRDPRDRLRFKHRNDDNDHGDHEDDYKA